jgi:hypothetical protein
MRPVYTAFIILQAPIFLGNFAESLSDMSCSAWCRATQLKTSSTIENEEEND